MNWHSEIWSCYYCGSYNGNCLYYCPHCNAKRTEDKRLNRQGPTEYEYPFDTPYFVKGALGKTYYYDGSGRTPLPV